VVIEYKPKYIEGIWMVISLRTGTIIILSLWTAIWFITNPVILSREQVANDLSILISLLLPFVISGVILEMIYRKLVWGRFFSKTASPRNGS
jgi:membrane protease YdiL (CAAX protease family)